MFTDKEIESFRELYRQNYGDILDDDKAKQFASQLIELIEAIIKN